MSRIIFGGSLAAASVIVAAAAILAPQAKPNAAPAWQPSTAMSAYGANVPWPLRPPSLRKD